MWSGIPVEQLTADEQNRLTNLEKMLCTCFIGQDAAVNGIAHAVQRAHVGLKIPHPIAVMLFCGPTGEGYDTIGHESEYMERHSVRVHSSNQSRPSKHVLLDSLPLGGASFRSLGQVSCNNLWNAKLFPAVSKHDGKNGPGGIQGIDTAMWLMGVWHEGADHNQTMLKHRQSLTECGSLQDIHNRIDFKQMYYDVNTHWAVLAVGFARASNEH
ncbi:unnamed protein product [Sphagnum jensenii]|uniref:Uncharacterized protein n=1 Tax=Sphagnum jensenii TaxID=128206 RepID=A0ABP0VLF7_9BRYO